jgi:hypothetical protein
VLGLHVWDNERFWSLQLCDTQLATFLSIHQNRALFFGGPVNAYIFSAYVTGLPSFLVWRFKEELVN